MTEVDSGAPVEVAKWRSGDTVPAFGQLHLPS
jgi:hypothetical protein